MTTRRAKLDLDHDRPEKAPTPVEAPPPTEAKGTSPLVKGAVLIGVGAVVGLGAWWLVRRRIPLLRRLI